MEIERMQYILNGRLDHPIPGTRQKIQEIVWIPKGKSKEHKAVRQGTLNLLYSLRANFLPWAYLRERSMWELEEQINEAIKNLEGE